MPRAGNAFWLLVGTALLLSSCGGMAQTVAAPKPWTIGFWFWGGSSEAAVSASKTIDVLYVHAGTIRNDGRYTSGASDWRVGGELPSKLPPARQYWLVFRVDEPGLPSSVVPSYLSQTVAELIKDAQRRNLTVAGVQFDIDAPTRSLPEYAVLLKTFRQAVPRQLAISITALLDWFRGGTAVASVLAEVDEFVPQFYDVSPSTWLGDRAMAVAAPIDAATWGPVFNRYRKPFKIGVSSFGRARRVPREGSAASTSSYRRVAVMMDLSPLDLAMNPAFHLAASSTPSAETVLRYRAIRPVTLGYSQFEPGDHFEFVLPSAESMRSSVAAAKAMGGYSTGVLFFRWPAFEEPLAAGPDQALRAAGVITEPEKNNRQLRTIDRQCAAGHCVDLYLLTTEPLNRKALRLIFHCSSPLEYFLPADRLPVRMSSSGALELFLPPYCGRSRMYLGRAVTLQKSAFTIEEHE